jgi:SAM-dependent methyltransferase
MMGYRYGYDEKEFERLQEQHRVWLPLTREHWQAGNVRSGDVVLDLGCGPGFASIELAKQGIRVLASDRDQKSLDALAARCTEHGITNIHLIPACDALDLPPLEETPTVAYMRWFLCYLGAPKTETLVHRLSLDPGSRLLVHDFINYRSARLEPASDAIQSVIETFYRGMKDADIGFALPAILERCGFTVTWKRVVPLAITPRDPEWSWPDQFFRLHAPEVRNSEAFFRDWDLATKDADTLFYSWPVLQLVAVKR